LQQLTSLLTEYEKKIRFKNSKRLLILNVIKI